MVIGVDKGHNKKLELRGVGYRASVTGRYVRYISRVFSQYNFSNTT